MCVCVCVCVCIIIIIIMDFISFIEFLPTGIPVITHDAAEKKPETPLLIYVFCGINIVWEEMKMIFYRKEKKMTSSFCHFMSLSSCR